MPLIDEAHCTQGGDMGDNLFIGFPNAVKIAFTGTPLLTERHKQTTYERFGTPIDTYKMHESVADRATVDILYIGRTSKDQILNKELFKQEFEDMFRERSEEERLEIQKRFGTMTAYLESKDRIKKIAEDIIEHYTEEVLPNGLKAQVVATSIVAACRYKYELEEAIKVRIEKELSKPASERDEELLKQMQFLKVCAVVSMSDNNELGYITRARRDAAEMDAIESFKKDFNDDKPESGVAILCVCDRLLTGFDAPVEQVMYLDKNLREHDLMQAIARVNRTRVMKSGYVKGRIPPVMLLSVDFPKALDAHNRSGKAKASEMEHAIRWHIKVNMDKDPALYTMFNERLQRILDAHKEHWDVMVSELATLRHDIGVGRKEERGIVPPNVIPFFELLLLHGGIDKTNHEVTGNIGQISELIYARIKEYIMLPNCWQRPHEQRQLESAIRDEFDYCGIDAIKAKAAHLTAEVIILADKREAEIRKS